MISSPVSRMTYAGAGLVGPFAFTFKILDVKDLLVTKRQVTGIEVLLANVTDWTLAVGTNVGDPQGSINLIVALAIGEVLTIRRAPALLQPTSLQNQTSYYGATHETEFDRLVMQIQELQDSLARSVSISETYDPATLNMKLPTGLAGQVLGWVSPTQIGNLNLSVGSVALPGAPRTVTTLSAYLANNAVINPVDVGADKSGIADSTVAMQASHNTGLLVHYPSGIYKFSILTMPSGGIIGDGAGSTTLVSTDTTAGQCITFTGRQPVGGGWVPPNYVTNIPMFRDFTLAGQAAKVAGAGLQIIPTAGDSEYAYIDNVTFINLPICIDFVAASLWKIMGCNFLAYTVTGVQVQNTYVQDAGDSVIMGCLFAAQLLAGPSILYKSSAGLKVIGNKFNVGTYGLKMVWTGNGSGDLIFSGNSVENMSIAGVYLSQAGGASAFHNVIITGNEFSLCTDTVLSDASVFLLTVLIAQNIFSLNVNGSGSGVNLTSATGVILGTNIFRGNGGAPVAIKLTSCDTVDIGIQTYIGITTNTIFVTCTNLRDHNPYVGTVLLPNVTFTTAFALSPAIGMYEVFWVLPSGAGGGGAISGSFRIVADGVALWKTGGEKLASTDIQIAGLNVQLWQNTGVGQTVNWGYRRVA